MYDLITLGETMLRLSPPPPLRIGQSSSLNLTFGGAESNVACNLARLGRMTSWWSRLPDNPLAHQLVAMLRYHGVDTQQVTFCEGERLGTYYIEYGTTPRGIQVWYDRANSAASKMQPRDLPSEWMQNARWLHLTGITPALSNDCNETCHTALDYAKASGSHISFDVNYRALLWKPHVAANVLESFCHQADTVFIARRDAQQLFGVIADSVQDVARTLQTRWGGTVIVTDGEVGSAGDNGTVSIHVPALSVPIVDRIGAGDAFASGVIDRLLDDAPLEEALQFGTAMASLKLSIAGDIAVVTRAEVLQALQPTSPTLRR